MSQFSANPSQDHIQKALYIVRYIAHTIDSKIVYKKNRSGFIAYADADWASDHITRISVTGYVLMLAEGGVSWVSRKQKMIALSSTEAEYMSMSDASQQLIWVQNLYQELGYELSGIDLCGDNQGAIFLASNPAQEHRSKHIDIRYHYICEQVENKGVHLLLARAADVFLIIRVSASLKMGDKAVHLLLLPCLPCLPLLMASSMPSLSLSFVAFDFFCSSGLLWMEMVERVLLQPFLMMRWWQSECLMMHKWWA